MKDIVFMQKSIPFSFFRRLVPCLFLVLLSGCATTPGDETGIGLSSRTVRQCDDVMVISGRVSMNYTLSRNDQSESLHGKFTWKQNRSETRIDLFSPLGQTMAVIDILPGQAVFTASGKRSVSAADADELVFRQLGWPLPVSGMRNWLQGCGIDANGRSFQADPLHPEITTQDGWRIHYVNWAPFQKNRLVPRRIDMTHTPPADAVASHIQIRLVIDEWHTENGKPD